MTSANRPRPLKLHLGCGEQYLDGYVNIDYPPSEHSVQLTSVADELADITRLDFERGSVDEIRLHHVFEHFDRPTALRLLVDWRLWLADGGRLVIETPDFEACARAFTKRIRFRRRGVLVRHMFGSHEAAWAVHWDAWYEAKYLKTLRELHFNVLGFDKKRYKDTFNITVTGTPDATRPSREELLKAAERLLEDSLVDRSPSEQRMHQHWVGQLRSGEADRPVTT